MNELVGWVLVGVLFENSIVCHVFYAIEMAFRTGHDFCCVWLVVEFILVYLVMLFSSSGSV